MAKSFFFSRRESTCKPLSTRDLLVVTPEGHNVGLLFNSALTMLEALQPGHMCEKQKLIYIYIIYLYVNGVNGPSNPPTSQLLLLSPLLQSAARPWPAARRPSRRAGPRFLPAAGRGGHEPQSPVGGGGSLSPPSPGDVATHRCVVLVGRPLKDLREHQGSPS